MDNIFSVSGKVVMITGSTSGIGKTMAETFGSQGAKVLINSRKEENVTQTVNELKSNGIEAWGFAGDMRNPEAVDNLVQGSMEKFGRIDVLINNAGGTFLARAEEITPNGWNAVINTNLTSCFLMSRAVYPYMKKAGKGNIINISTVGAFGPFIHQAHYAAAKAGMVNLTQTLAAEWGADNIRVNCIAPGAIATETALWNTPERYEKFVQQIALRKAGAPEEIAYVALFLATEASGYIHGTTIRVDGGLFDSTDLNN